MTDFKGRTLCRGLCPLQDEAKVIYSVGYPHKTGSVADSVKSTAGEVYAGAKAWFNRILGLQTGTQPFAENPVNAWGLDAFGLRIATVPDISILQDQRCA